MENFIEDFTNYKNNARITEDSELTQLNIKLKELAEKAKEAKGLSDMAKINYDKKIKEKATHDEIQFELLTYRKYKGKADMLNAEVRLAQLKNKKLKDLDKDTTEAEPKAEDK